MAERKLITFGEAMLRYTPLDGDGRGRTSAAASFMRSVGGDELNVAIALANLGRTSEWISVLPEGPLGDVILHCAQDANVDVHRVTRIPDADVGEYTLLPEKRAVFYQRRHSAFALQQDNSFNWPAIFEPAASLWCHMTGITPLVSSNALRAWRDALRAATARGVPITFDLNHRPSLGTFQELWSAVSPFVGDMRLLIVARASLHDLAKELRVPDPALQNAACQCDSSDKDNNDIQLLINVTKTIHRVHGGSVSLACCFKSRDDRGVQRRYSAIALADGSLVSTAPNPVYHCPKDECGGGSAWAAAAIDGLIALGGEPRAADWQVIARQADILAALTQENPGDHAYVTRKDLNTEIQIASASPCLIGAARAMSARGENRDSGEDPGVAVRRARAVAAASAALRGASEAQAALTPASREYTITAIASSRVVAIIRGKDADFSIQRGMQLVELGCKVLEVTMDTPDALRVIATLVRAVGQQAIVGAGTVTEASQIPALASVGCRFAISPINPQGFSAACRAHDMVSMPAAFTPQEVTRCIEEEADFVKLFPAQLYNPATLKALRAVGSFGAVRFVPSGGIKPDTADQWLAAGASAVAMGTHLSGEDMRILPSESERFLAAAAAWDEANATAEGSAIAALLSRLALP